MVVVDKVDDFPHDAESASRDPDLPDDAVISGKKLLKNGLFCFYSDFL